MSIARPDAERASDGVMQKRRSKEHTRGETFKLRQARRVERGVANSSQWNKRSAIGRVNCTLA